MVCPNCGSPEIQYATTSGGTTAGIIGMGVPQLYYCRKCGYQGSVIIETENPAEFVKQSAGGHAEGPIEAKKPVGVAKATETSKADSKLSLLRAVGVPLLVFVVGSYLLGDLMNPGAQLLLLAVSFVMFVILLALWLRQELARN